MKTQIYKDWENKYYNEKVVNIKDFFNEEDLQNLEELGISIEDKRCTRYEYEILRQKLITYYDENEDDEEALSYKKKIEDTKVSKTDFRKIVNVFDKIADEHVYA